jgi:hypothetical protein
MSKRFEDFMQDNHDDFDEIEPSADLWSKIEARLDVLDAPKKREAKTFSLGFVLKVAASIIVVMGIGFGIYRSKKAQKALTLPP